MRDKRTPKNVRGEATVSVNCARLHENIKYNNYLGLPFEIQFLIAIKGGHSCLRLLNPLKVTNENDAIRNRITEF